jgi:deferrochelatase/peroxidase EfeB
VPQLGAGVLDIGFDEIERISVQTEYLRITAPYDPNALSAEADEIPRGAHFLFMSAKTMATIEFLQQEWINDGNFIGAGNERDPIIGLQDEGATFTIPKKPVRGRVHGIDTFNVLRGGEYFFMPSLSALRWLSELG